MEMSVSKPRKTCKEDSKSSVIPILACMPTRQISQDTMATKFLNEKLILKSSTTSHRGDSGMKNNPGINNVHGRTPA